MVLKNDFKVDSVANSSRGVNANGHLSLLTTKFAYVMRQKMQYAVGFVLLFYGFNLSGQTQSVQRVVFYETSTIKTYAVRCDIEMDSLSAYDSIYLESKPPLIRQAEYVIENNWLTIKNIYPQHPYYDKCYGFKIEKTITNAWGTTIYSNEGDEYYNIVNDTTNENFTISADEIESYGFFNSLFETTIDEILAYCQSQNIPVSQWGQKLLFVQENVEEQTEIETDFEQLYVEKRTFRGEYVFIDRTEYKRQNDWIIPVRNIQVYYDELPSGISYQTTQTETYQSYRITGMDGDTLIDWTPQSNLPFIITISPDTANEHITVCFFPSIDDTAKLSIKNVDNAIVWEMDVFAVGNDYTIDINHLESGTYTVACTYENKTAEADFLKEVIEDDTNTNLDSVVMDIQILPNPANNNITVIFPTDIDAMMNVKIINIMGTVHFNSQMFVVGNTLFIDIPFFPAGTYCIFCINNNSTAYGEFIKE